MTAVPVEQPTALAGLPPMATTADPLILPGLLPGVGIAPRRVPRWITDPGLIQSVIDGLVEIPTEFMKEER